MKELVKGQYALGWSADREDFTVCEIVSDVRADGEADIKEMANIEKEDTLKTIMYYMSEKGISEFNCDDMRLILEVDGGK